MEKHHGHIIVVDQLLAVDILCSHKAGWKIRKTLVIPTKPPVVWGFSSHETREYTYWCVLRRVAGWVAGGCWDDEIDS